MRFYLLIAALVLSFASAEPAPVMVIRSKGNRAGERRFCPQGRCARAHDKAALVVLRIDTPAGSTPRCARSSGHPRLAGAVAAYVAPGGSRAASAGTFILYASHFAAMAPGTNLGAASPVAIGGARRRKKATRKKNPPIRATR